MILHELSPHQLYKKCNLGAFDWTSQEFFFMSTGV